MGCARASRIFLDASAVPDGREGSLMGLPESQKSPKSRTAWRWNAVKGRYEAGEPQPLRGTGEISAIDAFSRSTILLLGGTGFVGKVVLAMLLDRFPELKRLVVQVRRKKNVSGE